MTTQPLAADNGNCADLPARTRQIFDEQTVRADRRTDRLFAFLMMAQWVVGVVVALVVSPRTWAGESSAIHPHVWAAIFFGGVVSALPVALGLLRPGQMVTRYVIAVGQMLMSSLLIHITGGRIETHFHIFGSLAILAFYRDERLLLVASTIVLADHLLRGAFWPQSIFGVISAPLWRAFEHGGWVVFEVTFLIISIRQQLKEQLIVAEHHARQEVATNLVEEQVKARTAALEASEKLYQELCGELERRVEERTSALRASEHRYRFLADAIPQMVWTTAPDGRVEYWNKAWLEYTGLTFEQTRDWGWTPVLHPDDLDWCLETWRHSLETGEVYNIEYRMRRASDGAYRWHLGRALPMRSDDGTIMQWVGTCTDINDQKRAEEQLTQRVEDRTMKLSLAISELNREEKASQLIFDHSLDVICTIGEKGEFTRVSRACEKRWGYTPSELVGRSFMSFVHPDDRARTAEVAAEIVAGSPATDFENRYLRKDGSVVTVVWTANWSVEAKAMFCVARDVSDRKRAELELRTAKENAEAANLAKSRFLANMSHEIRTPMNGVIGMTSLLLDTPLTVEQRDFTETIRASGESLLTLINDILDFSKVEAGKLAMEVLDFDLQEVVEGTLEMLAETAHSKHIELSGFTSPAVPTHLRGDAGRLRQVLTNLVGNGIKFTAVGEVTLRVEVASETDKNANLVFRVHDTGIGIATEAQPKLFQAFSQADVSTTRKFGGTGLGLAISKQLIESMGGEMGLVSAPGSGSTFWFTVPFEKQGIARRPRENGHALGNVRVLIVDDNATNLQNLQTQLAGWQIPSEVATTGARALEILRKAAETPSPVTVAMIDQEMPGMDGLELARSIKSDPKVAATRLVLLMARGQRLAEEELHGAGIVSTRLKPVRQSMLFDCLVDALAESPAIVEAASSPALPAHERRKERILLAEDNAVNQRVALGQLRKLGYSADAVGNGFEAVESLNMAPYDIVLMDCHMPELDGYEATAAIRQREGRSKHTWIIAMTANAMTGDRELCLAAGMDDYIGKPVRLDDLAAVLERAGRLIAAAPAIDLHSLEELSRLPDEHGQSMLRQLLLQFIEDAPVETAKLRAAVERFDARAVALTAHALKGSSSNFGAYRFQELCGELERAGKARDTERFRDLLTRTEAELKRVLTALTQELEPHPL